MKTGRTPSPNRVAVERLLSTAPARSFSVQEVADALGLPRKEAAQHLGNIAFKKKAHNVGTFGSAAYQWGAGVAPTTTSTRAPVVPFVNSPAHAARPGCMQAYTLPSLVNGKPVERVAPRAMSSSVALVGRKA